MSFCALVEDVAWNSFGPTWFLGGKVGCVAVDFTLNFARLLSILTETLMSVTLLCTALRVVKVYKFVGTLLPVFIVGFAAAVVKLPSRPCEFLEDWVQPWWIVLVVIVGGSLVIITLSYLVLAAAAICKQNDYRGRTALRTALYPVCFAISYGLILCVPYGELTQKKVPYTTRAFTFFTLNALNGFFNVLLYSFGLIWCRFISRVSFHTLVEWPECAAARSMLECAVRESPGTVLESAVHAHICFCEGLCSPPEDAPSRDGSFDDTAPPLAPPSLRRPSINAFAVHRSRLVLEPPTLEHLFCQVRVLGQGRYGKVSLMESKVDYKDIYGGEQYALKQISAQTMLAAGQPMSYVWQERTAMMKAGGHPGVVRLHYAFMVSQPEISWAFVMEFCRGGDLQHRINDCEDLILVDTLCLWAAQTLEALRFLHALPILHRDLKPSNVLLTQDDFCKLADFGLATGRLEAQTVLGTIGYMAPEVYSDTAAPYTGAADIFSWGTMVYFMFSGTLCSQRGTVLEVITASGGTRDAADLVEIATAVAPEDRLDAARLKRHVFFRSVCWPTLYRRDDVSPASVAMRASGISLEGAYV